MGEEVWKAIPGFEGKYEVSDQGRVRSLDRIVEDLGGRRKRRMPSRFLKGCPNVRSGHLGVSLTGPNGRYCTEIHRLVMLAFVGPRPEGMEVCHANDNPADNRLENLRYDTRAANMADRVKNGKAKPRQTHCKRGHPFDEENTGYVNGSRSCLACRRERDQLRREKELREAAPRPPRKPRLDEIYAPYSNLARVMNAAYHEKHRRDMLDRVRELSAQGLSTVKIGEIVGLDSSGVSRYLNYGVNGPVHD